MDDLIEKMRRYCAYQERSIAEVREKLRPSNLPTSSINKIIEQLINENFINEERFVECFVRGKFKTKHWGKIKIRQHLMLKGIDATVADTHLSSDIDQKEYLDTLQKQVNKYKESNDISTENGRAKFFRHFINKGYEYEDIKNSLKITNKYI